MPRRNRHRHRLTTATAAAAILAASALGACGSSAPAAPPTTVRDADLAAAAVNPVTVSPLPGTSDASATTQISFLGGPGTTVSDVQAVGSSSGTHAGRLEAYSTGTGESFLPDQPFQAGEHVTVSARVDGGGANSTVRTSFDVALQAPVSQAQFPIHAGDRADVQHSLSAPSITPSSVTITTPARPGAPAS